MVKNAGDVFLCLLRNLIVKPTTGLQISFKRGVRQQKSIEVPKGEVLSNTHTQIQKLVKTMDQTKPNKTKLILPEIKTWFYFPTKLRK